MTIHCVSRRRMALLPGRLLTLGQLNLRSVLR
jgi:hypothetical protein